MGAKDIKNRKHTRTNQVSQAATPSIPSQVIDSVYLVPTNSRLCLLVVISLSLLHRYTHGGCVNSLPLFKSTRRPSSVPHEMQQFLSDPTLLS